MRISKGPAGEIRSALESLPGAARVASAAAEDNQAPAEGSARFIVESAPGHDLRETVFVMARDRQWILLELQREIVRLEDVFRQLTRGSDAAPKGGSGS